MPQGEGKSERSGLPESLRAAVERTVSATAGTAAVSAEQAYSMLSAKRDPGVLAERAQELLDEVARRGQEARGEVARRGQRTREGLSRMRLASADDVRRLDARLDSIERRLASLEGGSGSEPNRQVED